MKKRRRIPWLRVLVITFSIGGLLVSYLTGLKMARLEAQRLANEAFQVTPAEVKAFDNLKVSGAGLVVDIVCGEKFDVFIEEHPDKVYLIQRISEELVVTAQQVKSSEPFKVVIITPIPIIRMDVRNGAKVDLPACAVSRAQLTADLAGGAQLSVSGFVDDLFLFGSTGSQLLAGKAGPLVVDRAVIDMVIDARANLCYAFEVYGSASAGGKVRVSSLTRIKGLRESALIYDCP